jgi:hypothetical protein
MLLDAVSPLGPLLTFCTSLSVFKCCVDAVRWPTGSVSCRTELVQFMFSRCLVSGPTQGDPGREADSHFHLTARLRLPELQHGLARC